MLIAAPILALSSLLSPATAPVYKPLAGAIQERLEVRYSGYLPILGGQQGNAVATVVFAMAPGHAPQAIPADPPTPAPTLPAGSGDASPAPAPKPAEKSILSAKLTLVDFKLTFNGFTLPIQPENARKFFPGIKFDFETTGKVQSADIPPVHVPFRLPGLDPARVPELAYLPIEFPTEVIEENKPFHNHATIDGTDIDLEVTPGPLTGKTIDFSFKRTEKYTILEDSSNSVVEAKDAVNQVETTITGTGVATFDTDKGRFIRVTSNDTALSTVTNLQTKSVSTRKLRRTLLLTAP